MYNSETVTPKSTERFFIVRQDWSIPTMMRLTWTEPSFEKFEEAVKAFNKLTSNAAITYAIRKKNV